MDFGHALATDFSLSRYIPQANVGAVNVGTLRADAVMYRNRYGVLPAEVKGWPMDQLQHGQSTFWLSDLFKAPAFLAEHPAFTGVTVSEPPSAQDYTDLCFAASSTLGGAYGYLKDWADRLGLLGDKAGIGPKAPAGLGMPTQGGGPQGAIGTIPGDAGLISHPAPPPVVALPPVPSPPTPAAPAAGTGGFTPEERAALVQLVEHRFPGQGEKVASVVDLALAKDRKPLDIAKVLLPLLGVKDQRVLAALDLVALFGA